jgi:RNA polymerase sigma factor (sigma-70 family)
MPEMEDNELLAHYVRDRSEAAFAALVQRYVNLVYSVALRKLNNAHAAQEITQAVFVILARKAASLSPRVVLSGWLYQTARFTAANYLRTEIRRAKREQEAYMQSLSNEPEPDIWPQIAPMLEDAMGRLGQKDRNAVVLRFLEGKNLSQVGAALGASEDAAKMRVNRALEKLRKFFTQRGVVLTGTIIGGAISANSVQAAPVGLVAVIAGTAVKGSAISASTITLVKGALKLMAWTKAKTAAVAGAAVIVATLTTAVVIKAVHSARVARYPNIQGAWEGTVEVPQANAKLRVVFNLLKTNNAYVATLDSIDQGAKGVPVTKVAYNYPSVALESKTIGGAFEGSLDTNSGVMTGMWKQGTLNVPLVLTHTANPLTLPPALNEADYRRRAGSDVQGLWKGTLMVKAVALRLNFKVAEQQDGTIQVRLDSVDQGAKDIAATSASYDKSVFKAEFAGLNGLFEGRVSSDKKEITGTWTQAGKQLPLTLTRADVTEEAMEQSGKSYYYKNENEPQGHWKGTLNVKNVDLHLVFNIAKTPDGKFVCDLVSVDQGNAEIPATTVNWVEPNLQLEWKAVGGAFNGKLAKGQLDGVWRQGNLSLPLKLSRSAGE